MPTRNVSLTTELDRFVANRIKAGRYENASEVIRAALRSLDRDEREFEAKLAKLREGIEEGLHSGVFQGDPFESINQELGLPSKRR